MLTELLPVFATSNVSPVVPAPHPSTFSPVPAPAATPEQPRAHNPPPQGTDNAHRATSAPFVLSITVLDELLALAQNTISQGAQLLIRAFVNLEVYMAVQKVWFALVQESGYQTMPPEDTIHRYQSKEPGPPLPFEIFLSVVDSAGNDPIARKIFSLVCKRSMRITREIMFARLQPRSWDEDELLIILDNPHCTFFPYVRLIVIDGSDNSASLMPTWVDDFLVHMPKFTALISLHLNTLSLWDLNTIVHAIPPAPKRAIQTLAISRLKGSGTLSALATVISNFPNLTTLACRKLNGWNEDASSTNQLAVPPSSITKLAIDADLLLRWFTDLHLGVIESFSPEHLPISHPAVIDFVDRFGASLSELELPIPDPVQFLNSDSQYLVKFGQLKRIVFDFRRQLKLPELPRIIAQLPPSIEGIRLSVMPLDPFALKRVGNWSEIDETLVGPTLPSLRHLTIVMHRLYLDEAEKGILKKLWPRILPRCAEKSILNEEFQRD
ncbi:hypothetical protein MSAN_01770500 [Mycena sanguinolenta]|uniref:Uncharacterized protein n=1 Tax=Mycena sanguinolenta TaxID=230812 RepID=A0A8H7CU71_9AGAR|nr:hypothetical protein MSAN_01770500 [Mycena sanguinolenta]